MREFTTVFEEGLQVGLKRSKYVRRKAEWLFQSLGMIPEDQVLQTIPQVPTPITITGCSWPFPQLFKLRIGTILVCAEKHIYEQKDGSLILRYSSSSGGATWSCADFGEYVVLTNGHSLVERNPRSGEFNEYDDCKIPHCICVLNLNEQLLVGGPGVEVSEGFTGE